MVRSANIGDPPEVGWARTGVRVSVEPMGRIYRRPRSRFWWLDYGSPDPHRIRESSKSADPAVAQRLLKIKEHEWRTSHTWKINRRPRGWMLSRGQEHIRVQTSNRGYVELFLWALRRQKLGMPKTNGR
jgi:hypothetical protein